MLWCNTFYTICYEFESKLLHDIFLNNKNTSKTLGFLESSKIAADNVRFINSTSYSSTNIMQIQDRNAHGKIFGGHLMRLGFEISWINAFMLTGIRPELLEVFC